MQDSPPPPSSAQARPAGPSRGPQPDPRRDHGLEPDTLDGNMRRSDVLFTLEHLEFSRPNAMAVIKLDREVRDYLCTRSAIMPLALSDKQLQLVMAAAGSLSPEKRDAFLQRLAAQLQFVTGGRRPGDADIERAARQALKGLMQAPAA